MLNIKYEKQSLKFTLSHSRCTPYAKLCAEYRGVLEKLERPAQRASVNGAELNGMGPGLALEGLGPVGKIANGVRAVNGGIGGFCCRRPAQGLGGEGGCPKAGMGLELTLEAAKVWVGFAEGAEGPGVENNRDKAFREE